MQDIRAKRGKNNPIIWLLMLALCLAGSTALADGVMPVMPPPPEVEVYWQLTSIEQTPEVRDKGGYAVQYDLLGLDVDLADGLLTESLLMGDDVVQGITLTIEKDDQIVMEHSYHWSPLPIYLEPGTSYTINVDGLQLAGNAAPNSLLGIYSQGNLIGRISAGGYTGHAASTSFEVTTENGIYSNGTLVISFILRDVNDMFRDRIVYTYEMHEGIKPVPTPVPGFVPVEITDDTDIPDYYMPIEGREGLWQIVTAPEEIRAFGSMSGSDPSFFPADKDGNVPMNELPAQLEVDFNAHVKGFTPATPEEVPSFFKAEEDGLYSFTTRDGETVLRAYGRIDGSTPSFYALDDEGNVDPSAAPIAPETDFETHVEGFGAAIPEETVPYFYAPSDDGIYSFTGRDGNTYYRVYGRLNGEGPAYYPADEKGAVAEDAQPVSPEDDFESYVKGFDTTLPEELPEHYYVVKEHLYAIDDREGNPIYRVYGVKDGMDPAFYPADEEGNIDDNAKVVDYDADFEAHVAGFEPEEITSLPSHYEPTETEGVISFVDKNGDTQYRIFGILNRQEAAYYPSDAEGNIPEDALPVDPASDLALMAPPEFTPKTPETIPPHYTVVDEKEGIYSFTNMQGETVYRVYGAMGNQKADFYPTDETGIPSRSAQPVDMDAEHAEHFGLFESDIPDAAPAHYTIVPPHKNVYSFENQNGEKVYRIYGSANGAEPAYYPASEEGLIIAGTPVDPEKEYTEAFVNFAPSTPEVDVVPAIYSAVQEESGLYSYNDSQGNAVYRVYGAFGEDDTPAFYPADAQGNILSGAPADAAADEVSTRSLFSGSVVTPAPQPDAENTPIARVLEGTTRWGTEAPSETAMFTPAPQATARPASFVGTVIPKATHPADMPEIISRVVDYQEATEAPVTPEPATEEPATQTPTTDAPATGDPATDTPATQAATDTPVIGTPSEERPTVSPDVEKTGGGLSTTWWIVIAIAAALVIALIIYLATRSKKK